MSCCKHGNTDGTNTNLYGNNGAFLILVLYILLAIILGGILF